MLKILCLLLAIELCLSRYVVQPKFYAEDSAVIVDTDKILPKSEADDFQDFRSKYRPIQAYPTYHILSPMQRIQPKLFTPVPSTSTPAMPIDNSSHMQNELFAIAKEKLGLKRRSEVPSITELGELLGTSSDDETMKYIRHLTTTDQGIALIKAYLESTDYTDNTGTIDEPERSEESKTIQAPLTTTTSTAAPTTTTTISPPTEGIFDRITSYLSSYNFWSERPNVQKTQPIETATVRWHAAEKKLKAMHGRKQHAVPNANHSGQKPFYIRKPLPYHYPVPMRPVATHLNTPKRLEDYLQSNPKWADLAAKVGRLMLNNDKTPRLEKQLRSALEKAISQDEDLKKLFNSVDTLK